jgi:hypothetical protein
MNMKTINKIAMLAAVAGVLALGSGCQKEPMPEVNNGSSTEKLSPPFDPPVTQGKLAIKIIGSNAGKFGALNMQLARLSVRRVDPKTGIAQWIDLRPEQPKLNVLDYNVKMPATIGQARLAEGAITAIQLSFAGKQTLLWADKDGRHLMNLRVTNSTPAVATKLYMSAGKRAVILLDLDVARSVQVETKDIYLFTPVLTLKDVDSGDPNDPVINEDPTNQ